MSNNAVYEVDIDQEKVLFGNEWLGRQELAEKIKHMMENHDFRISGAGNALEFLVSSISNVRLVEVKISAAEADRIDRYAGRAGIKPLSFVRQAIQAYLATQPPLENAGQTAPAIQKQPQPVVTTITTEPARPGEEADAVELTDRKPVEGGSPAAEPSRQEPNQEPVADEVKTSWFKKS